MNDWKEVIIGDYIDLIPGYAFKSNNFTDFQDENCLPVIKIKNVANGDTNLNDVVFHKYDDTLEKFLLKEGDVLIAMTGNHPDALTQVVGDVSRYKLKVKSLLNQRVGKIVARNNAILDYIYYLFKDIDIQSDLANHSSGSANQANISKSDILGLKVKLPSISLQGILASILSSLDDKIDLLHRQNTTLEKMAETLFRQWFVVEAKEEWGEAKLGNFIQPKKGRNITKSEAIYGIYPVVAGGLQPSCFHYLSNTQAPVITISASGANAGFVRMYYMPVWSSDSSYIDRSMTPFVFTYYTFLKINQDLIYDKQEGSAQPHIYPSHIMDLDFLNYPKNLLQMFENEVNPWFQKIGNNLIQIETLATLRDTLLPKLMSGEVIVRN